MLVPKATIRTRDPLLTRQPLFHLSYKGVIHFRLCPSASDRQADQVLSLHMGSDPVHIPASPVPRRARGGWCKGTPESGAEGGIRTRGLDHGVVALFHLSYIRKSCEARCRPVPALPRGNLLMNVAAHAALRRDDRGHAGRQGKQKGPDPSGIRASRVRSGQDALTRLAVPDVCGDRDNRASTASIRSSQARMQSRSG